MAHRSTQKSGAFCLVVSLVWLISGSALAAELPANLVTNPSLEEKVGADGLPPGWGAFYAVPQGAYRAWIADGGRTGSKQFRIECVADNKDDAQFGAMAANRVQLDPAKRYVARGWVKVAGGSRATADVKLHYYDAAGAYLGQTRIGFAMPGNDDWQLVTVTDHAAEFPRAKLIGLAIACTGDAKAQYDDLELLAFDKNGLPPDFDETFGVTRSPQLALLSRRVGTWQTTTRIKPCAMVPQGLEMEGMETVRWTVGGQFLESRQTEKSGAENLSLMTYDARDRVYRSWYFGNGGAMPRSETTGTWDSATQTLMFKAEEKDGTTVVAQIKFAGNDAIGWQGTWKDKTGKVLLDIEGSATRRVPEASPRSSEKKRSE